MTPEDQAQMARAFFLYVVGSYLFTNRGQTVSMKRLALFRNFKDA